MSSASASGSASASAYEDEVSVDAAHRPFFCIFAAAGIVLFYFSMGYARKYATVAAFLLPVCSLVIAASTGDSAH